MGSFLSFFDCGTGSGGGGEERGVDGEGEERGGWRGRRSGWEREREKSEMGGEECFFFG